ncbi:MAG: hypothetical protein AVDCRST_MAG80-990, partial [uncultured Rubrobacteraceae bacterium]
WWIAKQETTASKRPPKSGSGSPRSCSTTCTELSPAKRSRAFSSIIGEKSSATPAHPGQASLTRAS